jgi:geranylgeranyl pyrophosphate synthase
MTGSMQVRELFKEYGGEVDATLRNFLLEKDQGLEMYGHMAYFMGFADENLQPIETYGGKRFRSSVCLMLADWFGAKEPAVPVASAIELFHNFTLIHDDIVDGDTYRRGRKTVWNVWGKDHAINSGDAQLLLVYQILSQNSVLTEGQLLQIQHFLTKQYLRVAEGQYLDFTLTTARLDDHFVTEDRYFEMIGRKTAALIAAATKSAGMVAGLGEPEQEALYQYGYNLGVAYQVCDDMVSIWGTSKQTGKRTGGDVLERKKTLPILRALEQLPESGRRSLLEYYHDVTDATEKDVQEVVSLLDSIDMYEQMKKVVSDKADIAKSMITILPITTDQQQTMGEVVDILLPDIKSA